MKKSRNLTDKSWNEIDDIEKRVHASVQSKLDLDQLVRALGRENDPQTDLSHPKDLYTISSPSTIAVTAGLVTAIFSFIVFQNVILSMGLFLLTWFTALDPLKSDSVASAATRVLGRSVIGSVTVMQPKLKAVARAAVTEEDEISYLIKQLREAEQELRELRLWKQTREKLDSVSSHFSVEELKDLARKNKLSMSGSKNDLVMRLLDADVIEL